MTRSKFWSGAGLLLSIVSIMTVVLLSRTAAAAPPLPQSHPPIHKKFQITDTYVPGVPAIPVHPSVSGASATSLVPAFSKNDVIAVMNENGFPSGPLVPGAHLRILSIQFVTAKQASTLMYGESVGRPDNYLVCYVEVQGPFLLTNVHAGPHLPNTNKVTIKEAKTGHVVFDAHTGNMLLWGLELVA